MVQGNGGQAVVSVTRYQFKVRGKQWVLATDHDAEIARLKAEVERLTAFTTRTIIPNEELLQQVERLTKAGDDLAIWLGFEDPDSPRIEEWNAAKDGKQS
jgi:uncharacterized sporulation protein YeaH/YhbH (DUF444 family)